jgi:AraC family transcriptional regulator of adaptative response / DNA-3-methyladenine glycosylase II
MAIAGIGDWTAQYVAMRALGWPDAFPAADVGVMKALGVKTAAQARRAAEIWRPWRGYAVIHLWNGATP